MNRAAGIRARNRAAIEAEIERLAQEHLAAYGAAGLSLRAIARDLGMTSSAIYRYVASRDELLTRLIVAAYDSLGEAAEAAHADAEGAGPMRRFEAICRAVRRWALAHPHRYALIYGSPVPGYHAPPERTVAAGTRVQRLLIDLLAELPTKPRSTTTEGRALKEVLDHPFFAGAGLNPALLGRALSAWMLVLGAVSSEVFDQLGADVPVDHEALFEVVLGHAAGILSA